MTAKEELIQMIIDHPDRIAEIAAVIKAAMAETSEK